MEDFLKNLYSLIDPETRRGLKFLTCIIIFVLTIFFAAAFILPNQFIQNVISQLNLPNGIYYLTGLLIVHLLFVTLTSGDKLYYGNPQKNCFVRSFQEKLPSKHLYRKLNESSKTLISMERATQLWFDEFNKWREQGHPRHKARERTFQRGYSCRFIYYLFTYSVCLLSLSAIWLTIEVFMCHYQHHIINNLEAKITYTAIILIVPILLYCCNKPNKTKPTGVWLRFNEINNDHITWIDHNLDKFQL